MNKKLKELAMHEKDTGSSEIQIALLTDKIEGLSKHIKQFKKDKHSSVGLLRAVNRRKKIVRLSKKKQDRLLQKCTVEIEFKKIGIKIDRTEWNETKWK